MYRAANLGYVEVVKVLLEKGALDIPNRKGYTPLHRAARKGMADIVALLIKFGSNPECKDNEGLSVFDHAKTEEVVQLLKPQPK